jgi:DNA-binding MarR family transcriptional regulator
MLLPTKQPPASTQDAAELAYQLRLVIGQVVRRLRGRGVGHSLSPTQASVLVRLEAEAHSTTSALAQAERVRPQSMAQTICELESEGFISKTPDPNDRRQTLISLTDRGQEKLNEDRRVRNAWLAEALSEKLTEEERRILAHATELLSRLSD